MWVKMMESAKPRPGVRVTVKHDSDMVHESQDVACEVSGGSRLPRFQNKLLAETSEETCRTK